jgi:hypothetical protein
MRLPLVLDMVTCPVPSLKRPTPADSSSVKGMLIDIGKAMPTRITTRRDVMAYHDVVATARDSPSTASSTNAASDTRTTAPATYTSLPGWCSVVTAHSASMAAK